MEDVSLITFGVLFVIALLVLRGMVHVVPEHQRLIVFRLGSFEKVAGPGIVLLMPPPIQTVAQTVDMREFAGDPGGSLRHSGQRAGLNRSFGLPEGGRPG